MHSFPLVAALAFLDPSAALHEEAIVVTLEPSTLRSIGGVTDFSREQFITIHESPGSNDLSPQDFDYLVDELEISFGRNGGARTWVRSQTPASTEQPDFPDIDAMRRMGLAAREQRASSPQSSPEQLREVILCAHPEAFYAKPDQDAAPFGPTTLDGAAEFAAQFLKHYWDDASRPKYFEVFNEPFVHTEKVGASIEAYCAQHIAVAQRIKELTPEVLVGGYTAAWPEMERDNFGHWERYQKRFMDLAGAEMDFFSTHIYDGVNVTGDAVHRTGSNSEAIIDLIDQYSSIRFGHAKAQVISEYGLIPEGNMGTMPYSAERSAAMIRSTNAQLLSFMDHPDRLVKTVPFFLGKALWTYTMRGEAKIGEANPFLLWRKQADGTFLQTDLVKFYQFWKGIHGQWRYSTSNDPDLYCHLLATETQLNLILMNIEHDARSVQLHSRQELAADSIRLRRLRTDGHMPQLTEIALDTVPQQLELQSGESIVLMIELPQPLAAQETVEEIRCYADNYLEPIQAEQPITFTFADVPTGAGEACLRLSIGRLKEKSLQPEIQWNGRQISMPTDWAGGDQAGRKTFFGMIEVPIPMETIQQTNRLRIRFPDSGGKVASAILQVNRRKKLAH